MTHLSTSKKIFMLALVGLISITNVQTASEPIFTRPQVYIPAAITAGSATATIAILAYYWKKEQRPLLLEISSFQGYVAHVLKLFATDPQAALRAYPLIALGLAGTIGGAITTATTSMHHFITRNKKQKNNNGNHGNTTNNNNVGNGTGPGTQNNKQSSTGNTSITESTTDSTEMQTDNNQEDDTPTTSLLNVKENQQKDAPSTQASSESTVHDSKKNFDHQQDARMNRQPTMKLLDSPTTTPPANISAAGSTQQSTTPEQATRTQQTTPPAITPEDAQTTPPTQQNNPATTNGPQESTPQQQEAQTSSAQLVIGDEGEQNTSQNQQSANQNTNQPQKTWMNLPQRSMAATYANTVTTGKSLYSGTEKAISTVSATITAANRQWNPVVQFANFLNFWQEGPDRDE